MADEIKVQLNTNITTSGGIRVNDAKLFNVSMTGAGVSHHAQIVGDTEEALIHGLDITAYTDEGYYSIKHLTPADNSTAAGWVTIGTLGSCSNVNHKNEADCVGASATWTDGVHVMKLLIGESCLFRGGLSNLSVKANTLSAQLEVVAVQN
jgi:hypothetical protein